MSAVSPNTIGFGLAPPASYTNREEQKKAATRTLNGLQKQVQHLQTGTEGMKIGKDNNLHYVWNDNLGKILRLLNECKLYVPPTKSKEPTLPEQLTTLDVACSAIIDKCTKTESQFAIFTHGELQREAQRILAELAQVKTARETLAFAIQEKAAKLEGLLKLGKENEISDKALDSFIYKMARSISAMFITEARQQSEAVEVGRLLRYSALKDGWAKSSLLLDNATSRATEVDLGASTLPAIIENQKKLSATQTLIAALIDSSKKASLSIIATDFKRTFEEMRNLAPFKTAVGEYAANIHQLDNVARDLAFENIDSLREAIEATFKRTNEEITRLQKEYRTEFSLEDAKFQSDLKAQQQTAIVRLIKQRDRMEMQWNEFCFALNEARHAQSLLVRTKDYTALVGNAFLEAEDIHQTLRHARKWKTNRKAEGAGDGLILGHQEIFDKQSVAFLGLSEKLATARAVDDDGSELIEPNPPANSFYSQAQKALIPEREIQALQAVATEKEAQKAGLVWSSEENKAIIMAALKAQKERFVQASLQHNMEVRKGYEETLVNILAFTRDELNAMGTALSIATHEYDHKFNEVYTRMNKASRVFGSGVSTIANGLSTVAGALSIWRSKEAAPEAQLLPSAASGEAAEPMIIKQGFKPFTSPLEAVSRL